MVITAMLLPGNRNGQVAARALARLTSGGVLLADEGYRGSDLFDWLYEEGAGASRNAIRWTCRRRRAFGHQPGPAAGRKQFFKPLASILQSGLRSILAWSLDEPAAESASLQPGANWDRV
jgi:hypothetical protein